MDKILQKRMKNILRNFVQITQNKEGPTKGIYNYKKLNNRQLVTKAIDGGKLCIDKNIDNILKYIANAIVARAKVK